ncbi:methionyl-tRNA formyltransferase, mitochondrial-like [Vespa mandarinia]|uniref:methionyl-tRNA formyltransferase, mitochondrial-like n=1 Tax=Vespa mandarinia TaxID=7446 RepID=UPI00160B79D7|nr:methionyl-tRNA formyltransferase, mitochondrial-like [Vespa mandarinia]
MFVKSYKIRHKFVDLKEAFKNSLKIFKISKKQIHTIPKEGPWSVLFFGVDDFSLESLKGLHEEYKLKKLCRLEVVTTKQNKKHEVRDYAMQNGIVMRTWPLTIDIEDFHIGIVVSFGHLIPKNIINSFPLGMLNVHGSLLPKWRGASPITYSLKNGDTHTGVTIMNILPKKFDIGEIIAQEQISINPDETLPELRAKLAKIGANLLVKTIEQLPLILSNGRPQNELEATYAPKFTSKISLIKWDEMSAIDIYNLQRALIGLYPLTTKFRNTIIKLLDIQKIEKPNHLSHIEPNIPGVATFDKLNKVLIVKCKDDNWISVAKVCIPGHHPMSANDFNNGFILGQKQRIIIFQ